MIETFELPSSRHHVRLNVLLLISRIFGVLFLANTIHGSILFSLAIFDNLASIMDSFSYGLWALHALVFLVETLIVVSLTAQWARTNYYLTDHEIIITRGIIAEEDVAYDLKTVRTVIVRQGWLGRQLNYGTIELTLSASGGYHHELVLEGIKNPRQYERLLRATN